MIDLQELKRQAMAATPGPWYVQYGDDEHHMCMTAVSATNSRIRNEGRFSDDDKLIAITFHQSLPGVAYESEDLGEVDSAYVAAANPATILDLIERLERAESMQCRHRRTLSVNEDGGHTLFKCWDCDARRGGVNADGSITWRPAAPTQGK